MAVHWTQAFCRGDIAWRADDTFAEAVNLRTLAQLKVFLDQAHIRHCLLRPWCEIPDYPVMEPRDLLPSFEPDAYEYHELPGFSMVALARPLQSFQEIFQYDVLHPPVTGAGGGITPGPPDERPESGNLHAFLSRLPRSFEESFRRDFHCEDPCALDAYPRLMRYIPEMDRAHVLAMDARGLFYLAGMYASFPSDADGEIKRFGLRTGKFRLADNELYEQNRLFVYQYLMELYGFPISSERRTSAVMFARRLQQMGETFLIRVLGQSDRTITTIWHEAKAKPSPQIEKIALVRLDPDQSDLLPQLERDGYLLDASQRIAIARIVYSQHRFNADNVRQDRALSIQSQELVHPLTGRCLAGVNIIRDTTTLVLRLNDITHGEFSGRIVYRRNEIVENTDTHEKRLKCLFAWLSRHQRRFISYSEEFYANVTRVLDAYLFNAELQDDFALHKELYQEVVNKYAYIRQSRYARFFEELRTRRLRGRRIGYARMLHEAVAMLQDFKFEQVTYFVALAENLIRQCQAMINDRYLIRTYIDVPESSLRPAAVEIRRDYRRLVALYDELSAISKARALQGQKQPSTPAAGQPHGGFHV